MPPPLPLRLIFVNQSPLIEIYICITAEHVLFFIFKRKIVVKFLIKPINGQFSGKKSVVDKIFMFLQSDIKLKFFILLFILLFGGIFVPNVEALLNYLKYAYVEQMSTTKAAISFYPVFQLFCLSVTSVSSVCVQFFCLPPLLFISGLSSVIFSFL